MGVNSCLAQSHGQKLCLEKLGPKGGPIDIDIVLLNGHVVKVSSTYFYLCPNICSG